MFSPKVRLPGIVARSAAPLSVAAREMSSMWAQVEIASVNQLLVLGMLADGHRTHGELQ